MGTKTTWGFPICSGERRSEKKHLAHGKAKGSRIEFQLPLHDEPYVVFEGDKFTVTRAGAFVDHREKIKQVFPLA
jgi:hypothetical protein